MAKIIFIGPGGSERQVDAAIGDTVMSAAVNNDIPGILADCGSACSCATCHVYIEPEWMTAVGQADAPESEMLELAIEPAQNSRLSCQIVITAALDGLVVRMPASQL